MPNTGGGIAGGEPEDAYARFARLRGLVSPPPNEIPGVLPLGHFLGRSPTVAAVLLEVHAYSTGLEFRLTFRGRGRKAEDHPPFAPTDPRVAERIGVPVGTSPHVAVLLSDATRVAAIDIAEFARQNDALADRPALVGPRGGGTNEQFDADYWLTPSPRGALSFQFVWQEQDLPPATLDLDEGAVRAATAAVVALWPWDPTADVRLPR